MWTEDWQHRTPNTNIRGTCRSPDMYHSNNGSDRRHHRVDTYRASLIPSTSIITASSTDVLHSFADAHATDGICHEAPSKPRILTSVNGASHSHTCVNPQKSPKEDTIAYFADASMELLGANGESVISKNGAFSWPPSCCDLKPLYWFFGIFYVVGLCLYQQTTN